MEFIKNVIVNICLGVLTTKVIVSFKTSSFLFKAPYFKNVYENDSTAY